MFLKVNLFNSLGESSRKYLHLYGVVHTNGMDSWDQHHEHKFQDDYGGKG